MGHTRKVNAGLAQIDSTRFVGEYGHIFYDNDTGALRRSDGETPGGLPVTVALTTASIGDLVIQGSTISTINANENIVLQSNGTGEISVIGSFMVQTPGGQPVLEIADDGTVSYIAPTVTSNDVAFEIIGNASGTSLPPTNTGGMLEITGQPNLPNRIYFDAQNNYPVIVGRRYNGSTAAPTQVLNTQTFMRIGGNPYNTGGFTSLGTTRIDFVTLEDQTVSNQGSAIQFYTTPIGNNQPLVGMQISNEGIYHAANVVPLLDEGSSLGSPTQRWQYAYVGKGGLYIADNSTDANIQIAVNSGSFYINGVQNIVLGQIVVAGSTLESTVPSSDITIGNVNDTGLFTVNRQTYISTPNFSTSTAILTIDGVNSTSTIADLTIAGTLIHAVNQPGHNAAIVVDSYGAGIWPIFMSRAARGTVAAPSAVQNGDVIASLVGNGYGGGFNSGYGAIPNTSRIDFVATDNYSPTARGSQIDFWAVQPGTTTSTLVAAVDYKGIRTQGITFSGDGSYQTTAGVPVTSVGISNGIAQLGPDGRLAASQIPTSLQGAVTFAGGWNASTNTPNLANNTSTYSTGTEFVITVSGTQNLGTQTGSVNYLAGGFVIYGAGVWNYSPSASAFLGISAINHISVNTGTGLIQVSSDATSNNTTSTIVARDGFGNFSANVITATLSGAATSAGTAATVTGASQPAITSVGILSGLSVSSTIVGSIQTANKLTTATTINGVTFDGSSPVTVHTAGTGISISGTTVTNTGVVSTATLMTNAVNATTASFATTSGYAQSFNTSTLVTNAVNATTASFATTSGYAQSFNTNTVVTTAVNATTATIAANVAGGYVSNISGGTGTSVSTGTGAVTISTTATLQTINTWTPTLLFATQGTVTYSTRIGNYIKIGQQVTAFFSITITSYGTSAGAASIGGLPFLSENVTGVVGSLNVTATPTLATQAVISGSMTGNTSTVALETYTAGGGPNPFVYGPATTTILGGTASFSGFVTYISAT